jgi:chloramphenicol-sensitive protein RarD
MVDQRRGTLYAVAAYGLWGLLPLYLVLLRPAGAIEILSHRVVWSFILLIGVLAVMHRWQWLRGAHRRPRVMLGLTAAALLIGSNWGTYIYGVSTARVVEVSLGYFVNPLISVLLGVVILRERLRPWQWAAVGVGTVAVVVLSVDYGRPPWLALVLAFSFGGYGLIKKLVGAPAVEGMTIETAVLFIPATAYLVWSETNGHAVFGHGPVLTSVLLVGCGVVTAVPLLLFAGAANRVPLTVLGICQYIAPTLQLLIGVLVLGEPMPPARLAGFGLVWAALLIFTVDAVRHTRGRQVLAEREVAVVTGAAGEPCLHDVAAHAAHAAHAATAAAPEPL